MENIYCNIILDKFKNQQYSEKSLLIDQINNYNYNHSEIKKILNNYNIVKPWDTNRSCGRCNYFDIAEMKTNNIIVPNSKLIVTRPTPSLEKSIVYVYQNWKDKFYEIKEKILDRGYYDSFNTNSKKIKGWFIDENILKFGTKKTDEVYIEFEQANLNSIMKQKFYFTDKETKLNEHMTYQGQLSALGVYFGFESKLARGDKNKSSYGINLRQIAILEMKDLELNHMIEKKSEEQIDFIDVVWAEEKGKIIAAFEVELKKVWKDVLLKFQELKLSCGYGTEIFYIIVGDDPIKDFRGISDWVNAQSFSRDLFDLKLKYLPIQNLISILNKRDINTNKILLLKEFLNSSILMDIHPKK